MACTLAVIVDPTGHDWPRCAEFSEGRAYQSLVQCARLHDDESFDTQLIGGAIVLRSLQDRSTTLFNRAIRMNCRPLRRRCRRRESPMRCPTRDGLAPRHARDAMKSAPPRLGRDQGGWLPESQHRERESKSVTLKGQ